MLKLSFILTFLFVVLSFGYWKFQGTTAVSKMVTPTSTSLPAEQTSAAVKADKTNPADTALPLSKTLQNNYHVFQSFNNCGPAALSMALSYYGINKSQQELGEALRPYQNPQGDNDDKSVTLEEVAQKSKEYGLISYHLPNGDIQKIKQFINLGIPVIARTYLKKNEDIGHYRIIKGYDDTNQQITQDDSLQGKNLKYTYSEFNSLWEDFNYEYVVLVPENKKLAVEKIIEEDLDSPTAWKKTIAKLEKKLQTDPTNTTTLFNLSVAKFNVGDYQGSVNAFEQVENKLPFRTLWYQTEPIQAYYEAGNNQRVLQLTEKILSNQNRAFSELYILRARVFLKQNKASQAAEELAKAQIYNKNILIPQELLDQI